MAVVKKIEQKGNQNYPLPPDYDQLTGDGQRQGRVNACKQWLIQTDDLDERAAAYIASLRYFDYQYLWPDVEDDFDPLFYDEPPLPEPPYSLDILRQWGRFRRTISIAPRGGIKSRLNYKDILLRMISRYAYSFIYATSTHPNANFAGQAIKTQLLQNRRIADDWTPEFPNRRIVPKRGEAPFGTEFMQLTNGSWLRCVSAQSRIRGGRPTRFRLDDPEFDATASTSLSILRSYVERLLFKIALPMVFRSGCGIDWIATFVSKRHYAWHALQTEEDKDGEIRAKDPRFDGWARLIIPAAWEDPETGELVSCWEEMWPATRKRRLQMAVDNPLYKEADSLEEIREAIGAALFNAEFLARPGDTEEQYFGTLREDKHGYSFENVDSLLAEAPTRSKTEIVWYENEIKRRMPLDQFLSGYCRTFITADTSSTATSHSDYKACCVLSITPNNDLFVFDLWASQCRQSLLVTEIFRQADLWRAPSIHPEVVRESISLFNELQFIVRTRATDIAGTQFLPAIRELRPGMTAKVDKIAGQLFRFEHGKIKLPLWRRNDWPWRMLFEQIESFNPDAEDGGLANDDCIDIIAMSQFVLKARLAEPPRDPKSVVSVVERLKAGETTDESGNQLIHGINLSDIPFSVLQGIIHARERDDAKVKTQA